ncbi:MAG TPA: type II secretion system F family protein, partial [Planctomycetaceae bacterium]|nr:type II secretion system F family protein [Planctomycetaceae bacterium]
PVAGFFWALLLAAPFIGIIFAPGLKDMGFMMTGGGALLGVLLSVAKMRSRVVDDLVVNMIDVGEETGELDTMLYKVADTFDEEVRTLTDGLMALLEPLLIVFLGVSVGFIVISLFLPLVELISSLSG